MKKLLLGSVALLALGTAANAADLARRYVKAPEAAAPAFSWTGFYLNGGGGYGLWEADDQASSAGTGFGFSGRTGGRGYFGTVGGGYDYQFARSWVAGIFGDAQFGDLKGTINAPAFGGLSGQTNNDISWAVGGRLGYLISPNALSYVNVGYSNGHFKAAGLSDNTGVPIGSSTTSFNADGWFVGGGVENSLNIFGFSKPGWFMKTEYRVAEYDRKNVDIVGGGAPAGVGTSFKSYVQTVSTSLVYRFNATGVPAESAAPIYTKAPAVVAHNWTGLYLSGGGGYELWEADQQGTFGGIRGGVSDRAGGRGYFGTVGGGYDYQFARSWVAGIFADAQFGEVKGTIAAPGLIGGQTNNDISWAVGGRLGYLVAPNVLSYANVGYSNGEFKSAALSIVPVGAPAGLTSPKFNADGWFIGGGVENSLDFFGFSAPGWFMKTEYRVAEYDRKNVTFTDLTGAPIPLGTSFKPYVQTVSTSLVYRFNWGGPVVAKY